MSRMLSLLTVSLAILLVAAPAALADSTVTQKVPTGGSVSLDPPGTAPTPDNPIVVTVTNPNQACPGGCSPQGEVTVTITKRTTPTVPMSGNQFDVVGPQHDISIKTNQPSQPGYTPIGTGFATFDVDASLLLPGFYGYAGRRDPRQQLSIAGLRGTDPTGLMTVSELPDGDLRYSGTIEMHDPLTNAPEDVVSYVAHRVPFTFSSMAWGPLPRDQGIFDIPAVRRHGFRINTGCMYACEFSLTATVSQKAASVLGLKSTVIAKRHFTQLPSVHHSASSKAFPRMLPLTSAAKAALESVPKKVKFIKFALTTTITAPSGVPMKKRFERFDGGAHPYKLIVKAPKKDDGGI
jgi:hypothetical protein